jgi:thiamine kinase-like enzyme
MAGNTSIYKIFHHGKGKFFAKMVSVNGFDISSFAFQNYLYDKFESDLKICEPIKITSESPERVEIIYKYIQQHEWYLNENNIKVIAKSLAELHNFCFDNMDKISLPAKLPVVAMGHWDSVEDSFDKQLALGIRKPIYENLKPYDKDQLCIPLHRDFKMHNIISDGENFHLIDFDFAAVDNIGIEIMSFIIDFYYTSRDETLVKEFIRVYKENSKLSINWESVLNDYLVYMCVNTFPFYMRQRIGEINFKQLYNERNGKLNFTYINKDFLYESLQG